MSERRDGRKVLVFGLAVGAILAVLNAVSPEDRGNAEISSCEVTNIVSAGRNESTFFANIAAYAGRPLLGDQVVSVDTLSYEDPRHPADAWHTATAEDVTLDGSSQYTVYSAEFPKPEDGGLENLHFFANGVPCTVSSKHTTG